MILYFKHRLTAKTMIPFLLVFLLPAAICLPAGAAEKIHIAVLDLKADGVSPRTARTVSDMLRTEFINIKSFVVIERAQMDSILREQGLQQTGCTEQACAVEMGKLLSARKILIGSVSPLGSSIVINARIVDVEKGLAEYASMEKAVSESYLDTAVQKLTDKLVGVIDPAAVPARRDSIAPVYNDKINTDIKREASATVILRGVYGVPTGDFSDLVDSIPGCMVDFWSGDASSEGFAYGLSMGIFYAKGNNPDVLEDTLITPLQLSLSYRIPLIAGFTLMPVISAGLSLNSWSSNLDYTLENDISSSGFAVEPIGTAEAIINFRIGGFNLIAGAGYGAIYEPNGIMSYYLFSAGIGKSF